MPKGGLPYSSRQACMLEARRRGISAAPCRNIPNKPMSGNKAGGVNKNIGGGGNEGGNPGGGMGSY